MIGVEIETNLLFLFSTIFVLYFYFCYFVQICYYTFIFLCIYFFLLFFFLQLQYLLWFLTLIKKYILLYYWLILKMLINNMYLKKHLTFPVSKYKIFQTNLATQKFCHINFMCIQRAEENLKMMFHISKILT